VFVLSCIVLLCADLYPRGPTNCPQDSQFQEVILRAYSTKDKGYGVTRNCVCELSQRPVPLLSTRRHFHGTVRACQLHSSVRQLTQLITD
jgi:hypothetical protein